MNRIVAEVEYFGSHFHGWQKQSNVATIQNEIENAIKEISGKISKITVSGRTDAGVHALGQIFHFDIDVERPITAWVKGLNAILPDTIRIKWAKEISQEFHARFSAIEREYQYLLYSGPFHSALLNNISGWTFYDLKKDLIKKACNQFQGEHDFSSFRSAECQAHSPVRNIFSFECEFFKNYYLFTINANGFLQHQIRNMLATIITIARGEKDLNYIDELFEKKDRSLTPPTFMPNGLYLTNIKYDSSWNLPQLKNSLNIFRS